MEHIEKYLREVQEIARKIDKREIEKAIRILTEIRAKKGRVFFLGVGGGAANASHAVNDFRKICGIEAYTPVDNVSEFSARINDEGWESVFVSWLEQSHLGECDGIFVFSVGGGSLEKKLSVNLVRAIEYAKERGAKIIGIVGRDGGYTRMTADACIVVPPVSPDSVTPHTESFQAVIWHLIVSHPEMKVCEMKWESIK